MEKNNLALTLTILLVVISLIVGFAAGVWYNENHRSGTSIQGPGFQIDIDDEYRP